MLIILQHSYTIFLSTQTGLESARSSSLALLQRRDNEEVLYDYNLRKLAHKRALISSRVVMNLIGTLLLLHIPSD